MVKFSHGCWHPAQDTIIDWAVETVKAEAREDSLYFVTAAKPIIHRGDVLNNPTITHTISSPTENVLLMTSTHWKAQRSITNGPHFDLFPNGKPVPSKHIQASKDERGLTLAAGNVKATVNTQARAFNIDFHAGDKLLTQLGWRSIGYVKQGTTALHPKANYTDPNKGKRWLTYQLKLAVGEKVYGLGERFGPFQKNGQTVEMWNDDGGTGSELTYKNVPFFLTSAGYGVFVPSPSFISFEIQSERTTRVNIAIPGESLSIYLIHGSKPKEIIQRYTFITGRPALPPPWTFGLWLSTSFTTNYDENTVNSFLDGMEERKIPISVFHFDCFWMKGFEWCDFEFDKDMFPDARGQIARIKARGHHICCWINPYIAQESKIFDEGVEGGYFIKRKDGSVWQYDFWQAGMAFIDFTNPAACTWYQEKLQALVELGVDSFKTDFGERIPTGDAVYFDGSDPEKMHNFYPYLYNKVTFEVLEKAYGKHQAALFARSATAGTQQFPVNWGGDPFSTFEAMAETLRGGLSLGLCGFGYWAHDIGGFEGNPDPALYKRWIAFGLLSSHSRLHGSGSFRVPWLIDETGEADKVLKKFVNFKHRLLPYLYATAIKTHKTGVPILRATFLEFPEDRISWHLDTQYMLGEDLLVAPIFNGGGDVEFYVPKGRWYGLLDGKIREGPEYTTENHGFDSIPVLLRPGSAIVMGAKDDTPVYDWAENFKVLINPAENMEKEIVIPRSDQPGDIALRLSVRSEKDGLELLVEDRTPSTSWRVLVVGEVLQELNVDGKTRDVSTEDNDGIVIPAGCKSIRLKFR